MSIPPAQRLRNVKHSATRRLYDSALPGSINLGLGEPDFHTPEVVRREACRVITEEHNGYTMNAGLPKLRAAVADYHNQDAVLHYTPDSVCVTNGVQEGLFATVMAIANPGDEILLPDPCFIAYPAIAEIAGARVTYYSMPAAAGFGFDRDAFDRALTGRTRLVFVSSPSNPTGRVLSRADIEYIASRLSGSGIYVVADEIYRELYFDERPASIAEYYPETLILSGLSKMMSMTGWRIGWVVGPDEPIRHVTLMHQYGASCASAISQKAAIAAFSEEGRLATASMREELTRRGQLMARAIERDLRLPFVLGEGAFYIMLDVSRYGTSEEVAMRLLESRVITAPGGAFGPQAEGFLRLSFSVDSGQIQEGIHRIAAGLSTGS
jgi:aspartate/methionine/tyrosine aminotransferase